MTDKIKTFWEKYSIQIITVLVLAIGFYFTTNAKLSMVENHEWRIQKVEIEVQKNAIILERLEQKVNSIDSKLDRLIEKK